MVLVGGSGGNWLGFCFAGCRLGKDGGNGMIFFNCSFI